MTSPIFNSIGMQNFDIAYLFIVMIALILILFILLILQNRRYNKLDKTYKKFMSGKNAASMEQEITGIFEDIRILKNANEVHDKAINAIKANMKLCYQKVGIVRYDAFRDMGGQLSFSIALLDDNNNGFLMNSVHSSAGCYTYTKEIQNGTCFIDLGDEEKEALERAMSENNNA